MEMGELLAMNAETYGQLHGNETMSTNAFDVVLSPWLADGGSLVAAFAGFLETLSKYLQVGKLL
ncbi:MAG: hypothetical protein IBX68_04585 [Dehalococcoidia bacterium]|nr:hypothetical protein [Dehalococcoidia bacterium]